MAESLPIGNDSLDTNLAEAVLAMIAARVHMGEEADVLLGRILYETDTMPNW